VSLGPQSVGGQDIAAQAKVILKDLAPRKEFDHAPPRRRREDEGRPSASLG
jgi:hypothetical protein